MKEIEVVIAEKPSKTTGIWTAWVTEKGPGGTMLAITTKDLAEIIAEALRRHYEQ